MTNMVPKWYYIKSCYPALALIGMTERPGGLASPDRRGRQDCSAGRVAQCRQLQVGLLFEPYYR
jgi:hypothetical protein